MPQPFDARDTGDPRSHSARLLGPYEIAYDTRRGYTEADGPVERLVSHREDEVWRGRGRDER
jgi:hypothetical protein